VPGRERESHSKSLPDLEPRHKAVGVGLHPRHHSVVAGTPYIGNLERLDALITPSLLVQSTRNNDIPPWIPTQQAVGLFSVPRKIFCEYAVQRKQRGSNLSKCDCIRVTYHIFDNFAAIWQLFHLVFDSIAESGPDSCP